MTLFERIKALATERHKNMKEVAIDLGFSENLFYRWKTTEPKARDLEKVANYFNVSVDYLLGRTDNPSIEAAKTESDDLDVMLDRMMSFDGEPMDDHDREVIRAYLKGRFAKK